MKRVASLEKLHPKLRMIGNGSDSVNFRRAELCSSVVSTLDPHEAQKLSSEVEDRLQKPSVLLAPGNELALAMPTARKKRRKLSADGEPDNAYASVFIEVQRSKTAKDDGKGDAESLREYIESELSKHGDAKALGGAALAKRNFVAATIPVTLLDSLRQDPRVAFVQLADSLKYRLPSPDPSTAGNTKPRSRAAGKPSEHGGGANTIIGVVDVGGFDFSHPDFSDGAGGTRFIAIWDQGGDFRSPPNGFHRGCEFTKAHLDAALKATAKKKLPATAIEPQSQRIEGSHGTHVASIAAGASGVCPKAMIAAVLIDIPPQNSPVKQRRTAFSDSNMILQAVEYLLGIARRENKPISINISLGTNGGAHDASSGVSRWLDATLATEGLCICVAAGNAGQEVGEPDEDNGWITGRIHASGQIASAGLAADLERTVVGNSIVTSRRTSLKSGTARRTAPFRSGHRARTGG
jgi:subtilisin family serine protease